MRKGPALQKRLESECFHFGKPKRHLLRHYREFMIRMDVSDNFSNAKDAYQATNRVNFMRQVLAHNDRHTTLYYMYQTLQWLALQGWHDKDSKVILNPIRAAEKWKYTRRAWQNRILAGESELVSYPKLLHPQIYQHSRSCALSPTCKLYPFPKLPRCSILQHFPHKFGISYIAYGVTTA